MSALTDGLDAASQSIKNAFATDLSGAQARLKDLEGMRQGMTGAAATALDSAIKSTQDLIAKLGGAISSAGQTVAGAAKAGAAAAGTAVGTAQKTVAGVTSKLDPMTYINAVVAWLINALKFSAVNIGILLVVALILYKEVL